MNLQGNAVTPLTDDDDPPLSPSLKRAVDRGELALAEAPTRRVAEPERELFRSILEQAFDEASGEIVPNGNGNKAAIIRDAQNWILDDQPTDWPCSFENICLNMGLDSQAVRKMVLKRWLGMKGPSAWKRR